MVYVCPKKLITVFIALLYCGEIKNVTDVYNIKISQTTRRFQSSASKLEGISRDTMIETITFIDQSRTTYNGIHQHNAAGLLTLLYSPGNLFLRLESALGHVKNKYPIPTNLVTSRTQLDDLILSGGYGLGVGERGRVTALGLVGIPLHKDLGLLGAQFGTGHVGLGVQLDAAYAYSDDMQHSFMGAARYVRFLSRNAEACINQQPAYFDVSLGNLCDILCATHHSWGPHQWELGYDATFAFGAHIEPTLRAVENQLQFMRSSFYTTYGYLFPIRKHMSGIAIGVSYGFDHRPQCFGFKRMSSFWFTWGMKF